MGRRGEGVWAAGGRGGGGVWGWSGGALRGVLDENYQLFSAYYPLNECDVVEMRLVELKGRVFRIV